MPRSLSEAELAELTGCRPERIRELVAAGVIPRRESGFRGGDVQRTWLVDALERAGTPLEHIAKGIATGKLSFANLDVYFPEPVGLSPATYEELSARLGRPLRTVVALARALGLPQPDPGRRLRVDDEKMLGSLVETWHLATDDELLRVARLYGEGLRRIAESVVQLFQATFIRRIVEEDLPMAELEARIGSAAGGAITAGEEFALQLHRRHVEHYVVEASVARTEEALERAGLTPPRPPRPEAIAFLDLTGYTALTEEAGDEAAAELAARVADLVEGTAAEHGGRPVKWLGDGVMFHFPAPSGAVQSALELVQRVPKAGLPPARLGIHAGPVVFREGDYFGRTVNVAARIADYARPREVLVSEDVRRAAGLEGVSFEEIGEIPLKGIPTPVGLYRAARG
ncbi:MAG: adenylate/guanylate cyclase domain-containing protein [Gaiellaceae bacterium]